MTLKLLDATKLAHAGHQALAFVDTPQGTVLASGPVRPARLAGQRPAPDCDSAVTFCLGAHDAAEYLIRVTGHGPGFRIARRPAPQRLARREINLPADRPVILLLEAPEEFEPQGLTELARLVDGLGRPPVLHPGSALGVAEDSDASPDR